MTLAVSDKCIPEWLSISRSLQEWGLVYWEAACLVWSTESCALESKSHQQLDRCMAATVWAADITVIVLCTIHFHPWLRENHTSAPEPEVTDWNRHAGTCLSETSEVSMSWNGIWLKYGQQPAALHWSIDRSVTRLFYCVSRTLWTFAMMCFSMICNCHDF